MGGWAPTLAYTRLYPSHVSRLRGREVDQGTSSGHEVVIRIFRIDPGFKRMPRQLKIALCDWQRLSRCHLVRKTTIFSSSLPSDALFKFYLVLTHRNVSDLQMLIKIKSAQLKNKVKERDSKRRMNLMRCLLGLLP